jgi:hypothetical protein
MTANTPGNFLTERVDRRIVLPAKVATFAGQKKTGGVQEVLAGDKGGIVFDLRQNSKEENIIEA